MTGLFSKIPVLCALLALDAKGQGVAAAESARGLFFRVATAIAKVDGVVGGAEQSQLEAFRHDLWTYTLDLTLLKDPTPIAKPTPGESQRSIDELLAELHSLIGLDRVKQEVAQLVNFIRIQQLRVSHGLAAAPVSHHLVFYGNPGTGKTTVARLISDIYRALGVLSKGHLVETDRSGLVAGYIGQTALKVQEVAAKALGGVLFVDEAYSLGSKGGMDFGEEAIETLLKIMEDRRSDFVVIVAGYTDKMAQFMGTNPGLKSRFNRYISFEDYTPEQLGEIFLSMCNKAGYVCTAEAQRKLRLVFGGYCASKDETFGNARLARNAFEQSINKQATRLVSCAAVGIDALRTLEADDIEDGGKDRAL